jgi:carbonic anhydrase
MRIRNLAAVVVTTLALTPCVGADSRTWGYRGEPGKTAPADWPGACQGGRAQSPINLTRAANSGRPAESIGFDYQAAKSWIANNGHAVAITRLAGTVQVPKPIGPKTRRRSSPLSLCEIHFHGPSEHTIENLGTAAEAHFVHKDNCTNGRKILVIGTLIAPADGAHPQNETLAAYLADVRNLPAETAELDPKAILPDQGYYQYEGSLTSPACDGNVTWFVAHQPVYLDQHALDGLFSVYPDNSRPGQPLNGRKLRGVPPR